MQQYMDDLGKMVKDINEGVTNTVTGGLSKGYQGLKSVVMSAMPNTPTPEASTDEVKSNPGLDKMGGQSGSTPTPSPTAENEEDNTAKPKMGG